MDTFKDVRYPHVHVPLSKLDGNAFSIIGAVTHALRQRDTPFEIIEEFASDAMSGDYDHLLQTVMKWVDVS